MLDRALKYPAASGVLLALLVSASATAEPPVVDRSSTSATTTVSKEELEKLPTSRDVRSILDAVPTPSPSPPPASSVPPQLQTPASDGERLLKQLWLEAEALGLQAQEAARRCDRNGLAAALQRLYQMEQQVRAMVNSARQARVRGQIPAINPALGVAVHEHIARIYIPANRLTLQNCGERPQDIIGGPILRSPSMPSPRHQVGSTPPRLDPFSQRILDLHNGERTALGLQPFYWNQSLAEGAQAHADVLARTGRLGHASREGRGTIRENVNQGMLGWNTDQMLNNWLSEKRNFTPGLFPDVSRTGNWADVGHYSQMIWPETTHVGCGMATGSGFQWLVCRYDPGGNKDGKPVGYAAMPSPRQVVGSTPALPSPRQVVGSTPATVPASNPPAAPQSSAASSNKPVANENFTTQRRVAFCGHMWIIIDDYDNQGKKVGEISLHFSPDGFTINPTSQDFYPKEFAFGVESTRAADLRLLEMWRYQAANKGDIPVDLPLIGPWSPANNCITQSMMWAWYGIETNEPVRKATEWPVDCEITPEPDWAEKKRRLGLAWDNADTVSEHLDVMQMAVKQAFWSAVGSCFDSDD